MSADAAIGSDAVPVRRPATDAVREPVRLVALLVLPLLGFLIVFYALPVLGMLSRSFAAPDGWLSAYESVLATASFWRVLWITASVSLITTAVCLVLAYPLAYFMARLGEGAANIVLVLVLVPFWTSILVRTYAWMVLLGRRGLVNDTLLGLGLIDRPMQLLNTRVAVVVAMVHVLLPFMVLPLYSTLRGLDWRLMDAAKGLGASPFGAFRQVILPLSAPGVAAGTVLVFTLSVGFYITPALVGGSSDMMISMMIENRVRQFDWPAAAAMAAILLAVVLAVCAVFARFVPLNPVIRR